MYKMLTTSLALTAFASLAFAQNTVTVTQTVTVSNYYTQYTSTVLSTYTTSSAAGDTTAAPSPSDTTAAPSDTTAAPSPTSSDATTATTIHSIQVAPSGKLVYSPSNISANVGDTVVFFFGPKNHTVTQSSFTDPCKKLELEVSTGKPGLDSEFTNPTNVSRTSVGFTFVVNATTPLWFYCRQATHCKQGMVFAINANENKTFAAFQANALNSDSGSSSSTPSGSSGGSSGSATGTGASATASSSSNSNNGISTSVNVGWTAVFAVVGAFILAL